MSAIVWQAGTLYPTGSVVRGSAAAVPPPPQGITNPGFESGATGWTLAGAFVAATAPGAFSGTGVLRIVGPAANSSALTAATFPVTPGQLVSCGCMVNISNARDQVGATAVIVWLDANGATLSFAEGNQVNVLNRGWTNSAVSATAPPSAASCRFGVFAFALQSGTIMVDAFTTSYAPPADARRLVFRAVQPTTGTSGSTEPVWPAIVSTRVNDGTVVWEAFEASIIVWQAEPILSTSGLEPVWPVNPGQSVLDNGIVWTAVGRQVKDPRCPHSKTAVIAASKVFAADGDVIRYSATGNPLDWSSPEDAGFLAFGLQQNGANQIDVLNIYRSNLVAFNASTFQMWQIDPDPEQMALLDSMEGIGSTWNQAAQPVGNELFYLTALGVRTVGIAGGSTNLQAGDVGMPIDSLVQQSMATAQQAGIAPLSCYYPAGGQYWLLFPTTAPPPILPPLFIEGPEVCPLGGQPVSIQYNAIGGVPPYTWTLPQSLPGWAVSANGLLTGTATSEVYFWSVQVADSAGQSARLDRVCDGTIYLTSPPYPYEFTEAMDSGIGITGGTLRELPIVSMLPEAMDSGIGITGGELRTILLTNAMLPEAVDSTIGITGGELRTILLTNAMLPEAVDSAIGITGGELRAILITNTMLPEAVDSAIGITGGTLE